MKEKIKYSKYYKLSESSKKFDFINNDILKETLYQFFCYIFLIYKEELYEVGLDEEFIDMKKHTINLYIGSIIEACLYYYINEKLETIGNDKKRKKYLEYFDFKIIQKLNNLESEKDYYVCEYQPKIVTFNDTINFKQLLNGAKDLKILPEDIVNRADNIRKKRNCIHVNVLLNNDDRGIFKDISESFTDAGIILDYLGENGNNK